MDEASRAVIEQFHQRYLREARSRIL